MDREEEGRGEEETKANEATGRDDVIAGGRKGDGCDAESMDGEVGGGPIAAAAAVPMRGVAVPHGASQEERESKGEDAGIVVPHGASQEKEEEKGGEGGEMRVSNVVAARMTEETVPGHPNGEVDDNEDRGGRGGPGCDFAVSVPIAGGGGRRGARAHS